MTSFINLELTAAANFAPVYSELARLKAAMASLSQATIGQIVPAGLVQGLQSAESQMLSTIKATKAFNIETVALASATERLTKQISQSKLKLGEYFSIIGKSRKGMVDEINQVAAAQARMHSALIIPSSTQKGYASFITSTMAASESAKQAQIYQQLLNTAYRDGAEKLINFGKNTQWAGRQLTAGLTVPLMIAGKTAAKMFQDVNEEMTRLQKVYGVGLSQPTQAQLDAVKKEIMGVAKELAGTLGISAKETTSMAADLAAAGLTGKDLINATKQASRMVVLGETDKQDAIKATISLQTAFKLNTNQLTDSVNFFNAAQAATSTNMNDLIGAIPRVGPVVKGLGGSYKDMVALLVAMKEGGVSAGEGANALKNSLGRLISPTAAAQKSLAGFGIDINGIVNKNAGNLIGMITDLQSGLDKLSSLDRQRAISELFGKFQFARMTALFNNFNREGTQSAKVMEMMGLSSAQLAQIADRQTKQIQESASGRYKIAMESFKTAILPIGESFLTTASKVLKVLTSIVNFANKLGPIGTALKGLLTFGALVGPVTMLVGLIANLGGQLFKIFNGIRMFRQGFAGAGGGLLDRFKGGMAGTKDYFKEADPALLASQKLSATVTEQIMKEEDAIKILTAAIADYAAEVERLQQIYTGGAITPPPPGGGRPPGITPRSGGTSGATTAAGYSGMGITVGKSGRIYGPEGEVTYLHAGTGGKESQASTLLQGTLAKKFQVGSFTSEEWEKALNAKYGAGKEQGFIPPSMFASMSVAERAELSRRQAEAAGGSVSHVPEEKLATHMDVSRVLSQQQGMISFTRAADALKKAGVDLAEIQMKEGQSAEEYAAELKATVDKHLGPGSFERFKNESKQDIAKLAADVEKAVEGLPLEEKIREFTRILTEGLAQQINTEINSAEKEVKDLLTHETKDLGKTSGKTPTKADRMKSAIGAARRSAGTRGGLVLGTTSDFANFYDEEPSTPSTPSGLTPEQKARLERLKAERAGRLSGQLTPEKSGFGAWYAQTANTLTQPEYEDIFSEGNVVDKYGTKGQKFRYKLKSKFSTGVQRAAATGKNVFGGKYGGATSFALGTAGSMLSGYLSSGTDFEKQNAGEQALGGLSKGMQIGGAIGQFLPPPYNMIATGAGAIIGSVGGLIMGGIAHAEMVSRQKAAALAGAAQASSVALEHFGIKVTNFADAAFKASTVVEKAHKTEIDRLAEQYKAQAQQDKGFQDQIDGMKRFSQEQQKSLLQQKMLADMAAGMTRSQAMIDVAAYMKAAGIKNISMSGITGGLSGGGYGLTKSGAFAQGMQMAKNSFGGEQTGTFLFSAAAAAGSVQDLIDNFKALGNTATITSTSFDQYIGAMHKQNPELADLNAAIFNNITQTRNLKSGTIEYQNAMENLVVANKLFADGAIESAAQLTLAAQSMPSAQDFANYGTSKNFIGNLASAFAGTTKAGQTQAATKNAQQQKIDAQAKIVKGLKDEYDQNEKLHQQAVAKAESAKEVQNAQTKLDDAIASGNIMAITAAQQEVNQTKNRIAQTAAYERQQASLQAKIDTAQGKLDTLTKSTTSAVQSISDVAVTGSSAVDDIAGQTESNLNTIVTEMAKWTAKNGTINGFFESLSGDGKGSAAGKAWAAIKNAGGDLTSLRSKLTGFAGSTAFNSLVAGATSLGDQVERVNNLLGLTTAKALSDALAMNMKPKTAAAQAANRAKAQTAIAAARATGMSTEAIEGVIKSQFKTAGAAAQAMGLTGVTTMEQLYNKLGVTGKYANSKIYIGKADANHMLSKDAYPLMYSALIAGDIKGFRELPSGDVLFDKTTPPKFKDVNAAKSYAGVRWPEVDGTGYWVSNPYNIIKAAAGDKLKSIGGFGEGAQAWSTRKELKSLPHWWKFDKQEDTYPHDSVLTDFAVLSGNAHDYPTYAYGGYVTGPGGPKDDAIRAWLSNGEYVINAAAVDKIGIKYLDMINNGMSMTPSFSSISPMGSNAFADGGSVNSSVSNPVYNISVNVEGSNSSPDDIAKAVMKAMQRQQDSLSTNRRIG